MNIDMMTSIWKTLKNLKPCLQTVKHSVLSVFLYCYWLREKNADSFSLKFLLKLIWDSAAIPLVINRWILPLSFYESFAVNQFTVLNTFPGRASFTQALIVSTSVCHLVNRFCYRGHSKTYSHICAATFYAFKGVTVNSMARFHLCVWMLLWVIHLAANWECNGQLLFTYTHTLTNTHTNCCSGKLRTESDAVGSDYTACFLSMFSAVR